jgi:A/G-specific adenine glycosylase
MAESFYDDERPAPDLHAVQERLLAWFAAQGRDLPWRHTRDPYAILVAEIMLQQTGVERVLPKYEAWLARFPTLHALAAAPRSEVIRLWSGLGYNSRAVRLHEVARQVVDRHGGQLPETMDELLKLKGIGRYTAGAVACFAYEQDVAFVDTNIRRVLGRIFPGPTGDSPTLPEKGLRELAEQVLPHGHAWTWHQALMDLGATVCTDATPACLVCPLQGLCRAAFRAGRLAREARAAYRTRPKEGPWRGSTRYYRGRIVAALAALPRGEHLTLSALAARVTPDTEDGAITRLQDLVTKLATEGLVVVHETADGQLEVALPER